MQDSWRTRRKNIFISILAIIVIAILIYKSYPYLNPGPTCSDKIMNGDETGIDCGGSCSLICPVDILPIEVRLARAVQVENGLYDLIAFVENKNGDKSPDSGNISYTFTIYDKAGSIIKTVNGTTSLPVGQTFPIIVQNVPIDLNSSGNSISRVLFTINDIKESWKKVDSRYAINFFRVDGSNYEDNKNNISQLSVTLKNLTKATFRDVPVRTTLTDTNGNIIAVNETIIKEVKPSETVYPVFTWRIPLGVQDPKVNVYTIVTPETYIR